MLVGVTEFGDPGQRQRQVGEPADPQQPDQVVRLIALVAVAAAFGLGEQAELVLAAVTYRIRDARPFGVRGVSWRWIGVAVLAGLGVIALNLLVTVLLVTYGGVNGNVQSDYQSAATSGPLAFVGAIALGAVLTPLGEELLFRGVLANFLARWGGWAAVLGSALIFAIAHGINHVMPIAFIVGVVSALLLRHTGPIWPFVVVHACTTPTR